MAESGGFEPRAHSSATSFRDSVPTRRRHSPNLVADLGTAPSHPAYETGVVSSRPPQFAELRSAYHTWPDREPRAVDFRRRFPQRRRTGSCRLRDLRSRAEQCWQVVRDSNPRARVLETRPIPDPDLRWSDRRDSNPHCRVGSAAVFRTTSDRVSCPGAIRTLIVALNKRSHCRDYATGHHWWRCRESNPDQLFARQPSCR